MVCKRDASLKHSEYYAEVLLHADRLYEEGDSNIESGLHLFDDEWGNIEIGQKWATQTAASDEDAATLASEYPERGAHCLYLRQRPAQRAEWLKAALRVANSRGFRLVEGSLHGKMGLALAEMGEYQKAIEHYSIRIELAEKLGDDEGLGEGICNLGILYDDLNMLEQAQEYYKSALNLADKISNPKIVEVATGNLGLVYLKQGHFLDALNCFERHLKLALQSGDQWGVGNALTNKGIVNLKLEKFGDALACFQDSISINEKLKDLEGQAKNLSYMGIVLTALGDLEGAAAAHEARIHIALKMKDSRGEAIGSWNLGEILIKQKKYQLGLQYLKKCVDYEKSVGDPAWEDDLKTIRGIEEMHDTT
jgi:tetratricopeptide (TPR) repeat protein